MNLFYLHEDASICAQMHNNKHTVKMIVEVAQMLSTAHRVLDGDLHVVQNPINNRKKKIYLMPGESHSWVFTKPDDEGIIRAKSSFSTSFYAATHVNHPSAVWIRDSIDNYIYAYCLLEELCKEYTYRYGKTHKTEGLLDLFAEPPKNISDKSFYQPPQCMPDYCKDKCSVQAYRNYYVQEKSDMLEYKKREKPYWLN